MFNLTNFEKFQTNIEDYKVLINSIFMIGAVGILLYLFQQEINNEVNSKTNGYLETEINKFEFRISEWLDHQHAHLNELDNISHIEILIETILKKNKKNVSPQIEHLLKAFDVGNIQIHDSKGKKVFEKHLNKLPFSKKEELEFFGNIEIGPSLYLKILPSFLYLTAIMDTGYAFTYIKNYHDIYTKFQDRAISIPTYYSIVNEEVFFKYKQEENKNDYENELRIIKWNEELSIGFLVKINKHDAFKLLNASNKYMSLLFLITFLIVSFSTYQLFRYIYSLNRDKRYIEHILSQLSQGILIYNRDSYSISINNKLKYIFDITDDIASFNDLYKNIDEVYLNVLNRISLFCSDEDISNKLDFNEKLFISSNGSSCKHLHVKASFHRYVNEVYMIAIFRDVTIEIKESEYLEKTNFLYSSFNKIQDLYITSNQAKTVLSKACSLLNVVTSSRSTLFFSFINDELILLNQSEPGLVYETDISDSTQQIIVDVLFNEKPRFFEREKSQSSEYILIVPLIFKDVKLGALYLSGKPVIYNYEIIELIYPIVNSIASILYSEYQITLNKHITNDLEKAKQQADSANIAKSRFLAMMSHEMRTPLNAVIGMSDLLNTTVLNDEQKYFNNNVLISANSLLSIINDVLDLSKMEANEMPIYLEKFSFMELIHNIFSIIAPSLNNNVTLSAYIDPQLPKTIISDYSKLRKIILNLLSNAAKFTKKGFINISFSFISFNSNKVSFAIEVEDTGIGIKHKELSNIFKSFKQIDNSITRAYEGTGLGLHIVSSFTELLNGRMQVTSEYKKGAVFALTFICQTDDALNNINDLKTLNMISVIAVSYSSSQIENIRKYTSTLKINSIFFNDEESALTSLNTFHGYDILIIDSSISESFIKEIKYYIPQIILISDLKSMIQPLAAINHTLSSPFNVEELHQTLVKATQSSVDGDIGISTEANLSPSKKSDIFDNDIALSPDSNNAKLVTKRYELKVLIVDDHPINLEILKRIVKQYSSNITCAENGFKAVNLFQERTNTQEDFDIIFMDCLMPEMDGYTATKLIREHELELGLPAIPIIAITANALVGDKEKCFDIGMTNYLAKPFKQPQIKNIIEKYTHSFEAKSNLGNAKEITLDLSVLEENTGNDFDLMESLLAKYKTTQTDDMIELNHAFMNENKEMIKGILHRMKGGASMIGAHNFVRLCAQTQDNLKQGNYDLSALKSEQAALFSQIETLLQEHSQIVETSSSVEKN